MNEQKALAILCKAYLKGIGAQNYDLRSFEYQDKKEVFLKLDPFLRALSSILLTKEETECLEYIKGLNVKSIQEGVDFTVELLKKHGGNRLGSGAKPKYNEPTTTIAFRVPVSKVDTIKEMVDIKLSEWAISK